MNSESITSARTSTYVRRIRHSLPRCQRELYTENGLAIEGNKVVPDSVSHLRKFGFIQYKKVLSDTKSFENYDIPQESKPKLPKKIRFVQPPRYYPTFIEEDQSQITTKDIKMYKQKIKHLEKERKELNISKSKILDVSDKNNIFTNFITSQKI